MDLHSVMRLLSTNAFGAWDAVGGDAAGFLLAREIAGMYSRYMHDDRTDGLWSVDDDNQQVVLSQLSVETRFAGFEFDGAGRLVSFDVLPWGIGAVWCPMVRADGGELAAPVWAFREGIGSLAFVSADPRLVADPSVLPRRTRHNDEDLEVTGFADTWFGRLPTWFCARWRIRGRAVMHESCAQFTCSPLGVERAVVNTLADPLTQHELVPDQAGASSLGQALGVWPIERLSWPISAGREPFGWLYGDSVEIAATPSSERYTAEVLKWVANLAYRVGVIDDPGVRTMWPFDPVPLAWETGPAGALHVSVPGDTPRQQRPMIWQGLLEGLGSVLRQNRRLAITVRVPGITSEESS